MKSAEPLGISVSTEWVRVLQNGAACVDTQQVGQAAARGVWF
jgi:hypothetical protein|eukprot:COSAG01_NODE_4364_length_5094_cov_26.560561_7_plen_42_part_00